MSNWDKSKNYVYVYVRIQAEEEHMSAEGYVRMSTLQLNHGINSSGPPTGKQINKLCYNATVEYYQH